jgi:hypothetical protein
VGCPTPADEFRRAVAVAIADAPIRLAQDEAECDAWAGYAQFTNGLRCNLCRDDNQTLQPHGGTPALDRLSVRDSLTPVNPARSAIFWTATPPNTDEALVQMTALPNGE